MRRSGDARQKASQNCPASAERLDTFIDEADLLSEYSAQFVARRASWMVVLHAREQSLDRFKRHPGGAKHFDPAHGFLFRRVMLAITGNGPLRRKQSFALVITQHSDADSSPRGEFTNLHLRNLLTLTG